MGIEGDFWGSYQADIVHCCFCAIVSEPQVVANPLLGPFFSAVDFDLKKKGGEQKVRWLIFHLSPIGNLAGIFVLCRIKLKRICDMQMNTWTVW